MASAGWQEEDLNEVAKNSCLAKLAMDIGLELEEWLDYATAPLYETLRLTGSRKDQNWTISKIKEMGGETITWMPEQTAWQMPFNRGKVSEGYDKRILTILHDTGRITRQEAASMLPVQLLNPQNGEMILDMCAAPGSKTTQIAEKIAPDGFVIANEPVSGRVNMLISNRARLALPNVLINQQDGRHIGRIPPPGFDAIVADVPCTGTATTRKNIKLWKNWKPKAFDVDKCHSFLHLHLGFDAEGLENLPIHAIHVEDWERGITAERNISVFSIPSVLDKEMAPKGSFTITLEYFCFEHDELWSLEKNDLINLGILNSIFVLLIFPMGQ